MIKIIIPMAGLGQRFKDAGYSNWKPLIKVNGEIMIKTVVESLRPKKHNYEFIFIVRKDCCENYLIDKILKEIEPNCKIVKIEEKTEGSGITLLSAGHLIYNDEIIVSVCDTKSIIDIDDFIDRAKGKDGLIATFETNLSHFCFVELNKDGFVRCKEKERISTHASTGIWYFANGAKMLAALCKGIYHNDRVNNEFYSTIAYNYLESKNIDIYNTKIISMGTPEELNEYINSCANI